MTSFEFLIPLIVYTLKYVFHRASRSMGSGVASYDHHCCADCCLLLPFIIEVVLSLLMSRWWKEKFHQKLWIIELFHPHEKSKLNFRRNGSLRWTCSILETQMKFVCDRCEALCVFYMSLCVSLEFAKHSPNSNLQNWAFVPVKSIFTSDDNGGRVRNVKTQGMYSLTVSGNTPRLKAWQEAEGRSCARAQWHALIICLMLLVVGEDSYWLRAGLWRIKNLIMMF